MFDKGKTTVLILPLLAMHDEYYSRAKSSRITCERWSIGSSPATAPQLLLVAVEAGGWDHLQIYINTLIRMGQLARLVVDEAHLLLKHTDFRPCVGMLKYFGHLPVPIVLITATLPQHLEKKLFDQLGRRTYRVLRRTTERPEIVHRMVATGQTNFEAKVAAQILDLTCHLAENERMLLFCLSRPECDRMAALLKWPAYHSDISLAMRASHLHQWRQGIVIGMACTAMLNCCLDYPSVRYAFHLGIPRDSVDFWQAIGRVSRDGQGGESIVYFNPAKCRKIRGQDDFGEAAIHETLRDNSVCRPYRILQFLDGHAKPCMMHSNGRLCDVCEAGTRLSSSDSKQRRTLYTPPA